MSYITDIVNKKDNRNGILAGLLALLVILFVLFFMNFHEPNPPIVDVPLPVEMDNTDGIEEFEIANGGGGAPSDSENPVETPQEDPPKEQPQQEESPVTTNSGQGTSDNSTPTKPTETATPNPFGNGPGGNSNSGSGNGFGTDEGSGPSSGPAGSGGSGDRIRLSDLKSKPTTKNNVSSTISLKLAVNADGRVTSVQVIRKNTTTSNEALIQEVVKLAKKEVKYKAKPNATQEYCYYTVKLKPS